MRYKPLGSAGLLVSEICLGTMTFGGTTDATNIPWKAMGGLQQGEVDRLIETAIRAGVNFIDTADMYSFGECERLVGQSLRNLGVRRSDVVLATKVSGEMGPGANDRGASRAHIMDSVQQSLERLQTDHIDLYQIHGDDPITPRDEILRALDDLVRQGLVRYLGVSNWPAWKVARALGHGELKGYARIETTQAYYSLAGRDIERELAPMLLAEGVGLLVWSPLAGGFLSGKYDVRPDETAAGRRAHFDFPPVDRQRSASCLALMGEIAAAHGATIAQVALAWALAKPFVTSLIIGARTVRQLEDNLAAADLSLGEEALARLDEASALVPEYPAWLSLRRAERSPTSAPA